MHDQDDHAYSKNTTTDQHSFETLKEMLESNIEGEWPEEWQTMEDLFYYAINHLYIITADLKLHIIQENGYSEIDSWKWVDEEWAEHLSTLEGLAEEGW